MGEPTNADIKTLLDSLAEQRLRSDESRIEWQGRLLEKVDAGDRRFSAFAKEFTARLEKAESDAEEAVRIAGEAMDAVTSLEENLRVQSAQHHAEVMAALQRQNEERDEIRRGEETQRTRMAEAAKKAEEARDKSRLHRENVQKIWVPAGVAVLVAAIGAYASYQAAKSSHDETDGMIQEMRQEIRQKLRP